MSFVGVLWRDRELLWRLAQREVLGRYRGAALGLYWSMLIPLMMLGVYTVIFSQVFQARWGSLENSGSLGFAINLFAGLIVFNIFSECIGKAPQLLIENPSYVKKIIFPLHILGAAKVLSALLHAAISLAMLVVFQLLATGSLPPTYLWVPAVWLPLALVTLSGTWLLSAAGVFLRDISQATTVLLNLVMFLSPIFYPISQLPPRLRELLHWNPIALTIEQTRQICIDGSGPSWTYLVLGTSLAALACELSFRIFGRAKRAFADVL